MTDMEKKTLTVTGADMPMSVQESLAEVGVGGGLLQGWRH